MPTSDREVPWAPLLADINRLEDGPARLALFEEAVRQADSHGDLAAGFSLRQQMFWSAIVSGQADKMLVAFAWCLSLADREPDRFPQSQLLWRYCYSIPGVLRTFPQFRRPQIADVCQDLLSRMRRAGRGLQQVVTQLALTALYLGDVDESASLWERQGRERPDAELHEPVIARKEVVHYHLLRGEEAETLAAADPLLRGEVNGQTPHLMFAHLLPLMVRAGRVAEAAHLQRVGYPRLASQILALGEIGKHLEFLTMTDNLDAAVLIFEKHAGWLWVTHEVIDQYNFLMGTRFLLERLREVRGDTARLLVPAIFPGHRPGGEYELGELITVVADAAAKLAARYDERAGNDWFSRTSLAFSRSLHGSIVPFPMATGRREKNVKG